MIDATFFAIQEMRNAFGELRRELERQPFAEPASITLLRKLEGKMQGVLDRIGRADYTPK